ncbi:MAG TPA: hypothetical protein VJ654_17580 [Noviherbaspirillum sp.]|nr:hypothetical protein [Noviherbaspirillum sp.]
MTDIEELKKRLNLNPEDIGGPSGMDMMRERKEAADALTRLQAENAELRQKCDHIMTEHGKRLEEVARLREDAQRLDYLETQNGFVAGWDADSGKGNYRMMLSHKSFPTLRDAIDASRSKAKITG